MNQEIESNKTIGPYQIQKLIGKGGMGEVFLAYDTECKRQIALKRIRPELNKNSVIRERFLLEAKIAASLVHPAIIPIFSIYAEDDSLYYTMPYVEGKTLKDILLEARKNYVKGIPVGVEGSIPNLMRIFIQICEAVSYIHANKILHRDLKPDNMIIGKYGEVLILDWGIANYLNASTDCDETNFIEDNQNTNLTRPGKIAGTLTHVAPERASGAPASIQTDIYSLGVMLYQILALTTPFPRTNLEEFKKYVKHEKFTDPTDLAPFRDIPQELVVIAKKCLEPDPKNRYKQVGEMVKDLVSFSEGKPKWLFSRSLSITKSDDWAFEANLLPAKNVAISGLTDLPEWVHAMISAESFGDNVCMQTKITLKEDSFGIGFLVAMPESIEANFFDEGYCIWLSSKEKGSSRLYRRGVHVMNIPMLNLTPGKEVSITIEKVDKTLSLFIDGHLVLNYLSHTPISGRCIGVVHKDTDYSLSPINIYTTSYNAQISCLALPDAFLAKKDFDSALAEYRHIGKAFFGRAEGREALFRAGLTLLEKGKGQKSKKKKKAVFSEALKEFEELRNTSGAPLEYLGKSLIYAAQGDAQEEAKCLELACRKYPRHPLLTILYEHVLYRVHESSLNNREAAYRLILFALRYVPYFLESTESIALIDSLQKHWEKLPFLFISDGSDPKTDLKTQLCYRLGRAPLIAEMIENNDLENDTLENALFALLNLNHIQSSTKLFNKACEMSVLSAHSQYLIKAALLTHNAYPKKAIDQFLESTKEIPSFTEKEWRAAFHIIQNALDKKELQSLGPFIERIENKAADNPLAKQTLDRYKIWTSLLSEDWNSASDLFHKYPTEVLEEETSGFHFLYGCYLYFQEGKDIAKIHFEGVLDTLYPYSPVLLSYHMQDKIKNWQKSAFYFEKRELYRQLELFYQCDNQNEQAGKFQKLIAKQSQ